MGRRLRRFWHGLPDDERTPPGVKMLLIAFVGFWAIFYYFKGDEFPPLNITVMSAILAVVLWLMLLSSYRKARARAGRSEARR